MGIPQARILEWVTIPSTKGPSQLRDQKRGLPHCRWILYRLSHQGSPRILGWVAIPFSSGSPQPRSQTGVSCIAGGFFTNWTIREGSSFAIISPRIIPFQTQWYCYSLNIFIWALIYLPVYPLLRKLFRLVSLWLVGPLPSSVNSYTTFSISSSLSTLCKTEIPPITCQCIMSQSCSMHSLIVLTKGMWERKPYLIS